MVGHDVTFGLVEALEAGPVSRSCSVRAGVEKLDVEPALSADRIWEHSHLNITRGIGGTRCSRVWGRGSTAQNSE